jgi:hypothetical protein
LHPAPTPVADGVRGLSRRIKFLHIDPDELARAQPRPLMVPGGVGSVGNHTAETDCVAGHVRLELRNVAANYPVERSPRFPGIKPNSGHRDYSGLSCGGRETQLGPSAEISAGFLAPALRTSATAFLVAKNVIQIAKGGQRDPKRLSERVIRALQSHPLGETRRP